MFPASMHGVDKAAILLLAPAIAHGLPATAISDLPSTESGEHAVVFRIDTGAVIVRFQVPCAGCDHDPWPIDLVTQSASGICEDVAISVNGRDLEHRWHGNTSWGSGAIPASPSQYRGSEMSAKWQSKCMKLPLEAPSGGSIHALTMFLNNGTSSSQDHVGFTISFTLSDQIEMRRLSNWPLRLSDELEWETWVYSYNAEGGSELQTFQHDVQESQHLMTLQDESRRSTSHTNSYQHQKRENGILGVEIPADYPTRKFARNCAIAFLIILTSCLLFRIIRRSTAFRRRRRDIASRHEERRARRAYNNAARRLRWRQWWEGSSRSNSDTRSVRSSHSLAELQHPTTDHLQHNPSDHHSHHGDHRYSDVDDDGDDYDSFLEDEDNNNMGGGMMRDEILGLRRVLEYVGELVGNESSSVSRRNNRSRSRSRPPPRYDELHQSPRASTMFSLDTRSLATLDTTDSETAPPSYHA